MDSSKDSPDRRAPVIRAPPMLDRATMIDRATGIPVRRPPTPISGAASPYPSYARYSASPGYGRYSPDYSDEGPRRFAGDSPLSPYRAPPPPPPPPGFLDESPRRFRSRGGSPPDRYRGGPPPPGFSREYDSPPYRYSSPPSPEFRNEGLRRFEGSPRLRYTPGPRDGALRSHETQSPPYRYTDESPRRFAGGLSPTHYLEGPEGFGNSPPRYLQDTPGRSPRRFAGGLSPMHYLEGPEGFESSPQRYLQRTPRRSPQRYLEAPPPRDSPPPPYLDDGIRRFHGGGTPPRLEDDVRRYTGESFDSPPQPGRRYDGRTTPPRYVEFQPSAATTTAAGGRYEEDAKPRKSSPSDSPSPPLPAAGVVGSLPNIISSKFLPPKDDGSPPSPPPDYPTVSNLPPQSFADEDSVYGSPTRGSSIGGSVYSSPARASVFGGSVYGSPARDGFATPRGHLSSSAGSSPPTPPRDSPPSLGPVAFRAKAFSPDSAAPVVYNENLAPRPDVSPPQMLPPSARPDVSPSWYPSRRTANLGTPPRFDDRCSPSPPIFVPSPPPVNVANVAHPYFKEEYSFHMPLPRRAATGYTISTPTRDIDYTGRDIGDHAIHTDNFPPIFIDEKLKERTPHQGNPGSASGGGWKDLWAAVVFLLHLGGVGAISLVYGLKGLTSTIEEFGTPGAFRIIDWFPQLSAAGIAGAAFAIVWQMAFRMAPVGMILFTIWSGAVAMSILGIVLIATGKTTGLIGLLFFFAGLSQCLYAFVVRHRVPFAGDLLKKIITILNRYPSTYLVSYFWVLLGCGWTGVIIFGISGIAKRANHSFIMVGFVASLVWTMQVLRNVIRVAVAGTVSNFYVHGLNNMPHMPTYVALLRACSISLGSVCFGSFIVPLVEVPCHALRRISAQGGESEFLFSCVACFLHCFEGLIRYFNKWAYIQVAMYGKPFVRASKDTWDMLRVQKVDCLIHDDLIGSIMLISCCVGGSLSAIVGGTWTFVVHKSLTISIAVISFVIGFLFTYLTLAVYESGVATYYVMFAEDPASLQRHDGPLFEKMFVRQMELSPEEFANPVVLI